MVRAIMAWTIISHCKIFAKGVAFILTINQKINQSARLQAWQTPLYLASLRELYRDDL